jgi:hypothetical protein
VIALGLVAQPVRQHQQSGIGIGERGDTAALGKTLFAAGTGSATWP